jgi:subtilisin family serine protease
MTLTKVKSDTDGSSASATYKQILLHTPLPNRNTLGLSALSHGDIVAGIAAGDEGVSVESTSDRNQITAVNTQGTNMTGCKVQPSTSSLTCDKLLFAQSALVLSTVTYRLTPGIARNARLIIQPVILGANANAKQQWANISGAMTNASKTSKVINLSLGADIPDNELSVTEMLAVLDASPYTSAPDAVFTVAAGNNGGPCNKNQMSTIFNGCNTIAVALTYQNPTKSSTLVVGALDSDGRAIAKYSTRAGLLAQRYLLAPGDSGYLETSTKGTAETTFTGIAGTSFAAPRVAGAAAILRGMFPKLSAANIANALLLSADKDINGDGTPDFNGVSETYGHGKLDLQRAIDYLKGDLKVP